MNALRTAALVLAALTLAACSGSRVGACPERFDSQAWRGAAFDSEQRRRLALQVERCGYVRRASKPRVRELLGQPERPEPEYRSEFKREWYYPVGETNGEYGPADQQDLRVAFDKRGRVRRAELSPP